MKKFMFTIVFAALVLGALSGCMKENLGNIDVKVDGNLKTTFSTGSGSAGMYSRARAGISF